mmetsp:Transcript_50668/g.94701  ORF Transcript_50668/g.94701 Transcript_50668/m.94701 type:complete len:1532 (+) Transcript_50668:320-4915(+)
MSAPDQASPRVMETAADAESPEKTPAQRTEGYDATTRRMLMGTSDHPEQKKHKSPHRGAEAGLVRDDDDDESQAKRGGRVRHDSIMITAPRSHPEQGGGYAEAYKRIRAEEEAEQAREAEALGIDNADILNPHLISHSRTDDRRRQLASTGTSAEESSSDEDDSQESESRRRDKDKRKQPKLSMIEKVRHGCKVGRGWAKWLAKRAWEEVTCHYRKRKIMLEKNEWMTHELKERVERLLIIRKKYREIYQSKAEELKGRAKRKAIPKYQLYWYLLWLRVAYVWHDFYAFASNLLGFVHRGTGLPLSVMEWYHFERLLNEGPHGRTYMALDSKGRTVAVKIRDKSRGMVMWLPLKRATYTISWQITPRRFAMIQRVLAHFGLVSMPFDHDHVVKVFAVYDNAEFFVEVSEYMSGGSLLNFCEDVDGAMDEHSVCQVFTRILLALQYMHGRRILHRDLRLSQILLARSMRLDEVKLSDFWFMTRVPAKSFLNENSLPGDVATRAPEVILRGEWSIKADIWSAGCVLFELLFGHPPFGGHGEALVDRICRQGPEFDVLCGKISDGAMDLLRLCLKRSVAHRPTAKTLLQHRWFREYGGDRKAKSKQSLADRLNKRARRIKRVAIYGKEAAHRRGLPPRNLLAAKSGMFNSGFCTPMGLTKCTIDLIVGDKDEESMDRRQYWVKTIMVSLWGSQDNPRKIVAYGAQRPNIPWVQLAEHSVKSVRAAEARLVIDRPLRFVRLVMTGNFGGIYGIALQKLTMYGFEIVQEPIVFALDKCHYARGAAAHTHREDFKESDLNNLNKVVRESLERGSRIPGTGQRYYVYRDIFSGTPHTTTVAQMYVKMIKGNTICAATLSLRFVAYAPTLSSTPRIRIGVDAEEGRVVMCTTRALPVANWDAEKVCKQGYSDMETLWVTDLNISTDNGFAIELHFENNSGYVHVPADCGLTLYYIPDVAEFSDDSDMDEHQSMSKMARKNRREGVDMGVFEGITQELQEADAVGKEEHEHHHHHHHHHHHGEGHHGEKSDDPLAALRNQEQEEDKVSILSEGQEGLMQDDLKEMEVNIKYGRWGASNFRTGDVEAWYPRWVGHGSQYHEKGAAPSRKSEVPDVEQEEGEEGEEEDAASSVSSAVKPPKEEGPQTGRLWLNWDSLERRVKRGKWIGVSASVDNTLKVWDFSSRECRGTLSGVHEGSVRVVALDVERRVACAGAMDGTVGLWDLEECECNDSYLSGKLGAMLCIDPGWERKRVVTGTGEGMICIWDAETCSCKTHWTAHEGARVLAVKADFAKGRIISGGADGQLHQWDIETEKCLGTFEPQRRRASALFSNPVTTIAADFEQRRAIAGYDDGTMHLINLDGVDSIGSLDGHIDRVNAVQVDWPNHMLVSASEDDTLRVWDLESCRSMGELKGHTRGVRCIDVDFEEEILVSGSDDSTLRVWDLDSLKCKGTLEGHTDRVTCLRARFDREMVISGSADCTLRLWDLDTMELEETFYGHGDAVTTLAAAGSKALPKDPEEAAAEAPVEPRRNTEAHKHLEQD